MASQAQALVVAGVLYGAGFGAAQSALMAWCVDRAGPHARGRAMGTYFAGFELGTGLGAILSGLMIGWAGFAAIFVIVVAAAAAGAVLALAAGRSTPPPGID